MAATPRQRRFTPCRRRCWTPTRSVPRSRPARMPAPISRGSAKPTSRRWMPGNGANSFAGCSSATNSRCAGKSSTMSHRSKDPDRTMGAYAQCAERLIERGFAVVPIMPGTKRPGFFFAGMWIGLANWQKRFSGGLPPPAERERWAAGDAGIGVVAGEASHGLIAVDIDSEDPAIQATLRTLLPPTHVRKTGARGETLFYHGPDVAQSQSWDIAG